MELNNIKMINYKIPNQKSTEELKKILKDRYHCDNLNKKELKNVEEVFISYFDLLANIHYEDKRI
jgi:hypothetical protein